MDNNIFAEAKESQEEKIAVMKVPVVLLDITETCVKLRQSRSQLWKTRKQADFPKARQITEKRIGFIESELDTYIMALPVVVYKEIKISCADKQKN